MKEKAQQEARLFPADERCHYVATTRLVVASDFQIPYHDPSAVNLFLQFVSRWKPDTIVLAGDVVDCYGQSQFTKDPKRLVTYSADEKEGVQALLKTLSKRKCRIIWLGGNHEDRVRRVLNNAVERYMRDSRLPLAGYESYGDALAGGGTADDVFRRRHLLSFPDCDYWPYGHFVKIAKGNLLITHGCSVSKHSGYTAKAHFERWGQSGIIGHSHRMGSYYAKNQRGIHGVWECGCLADMNPEYVQFPNWQQGFIAVTVDGDSFHVDQIPILPGYKVRYAGWKDLCA